VVAGRGLNITPAELSRRTFTDQLNNVTLFDVRRWPTT
jgi:hypothetical protein